MLLILWEDELSRPLPTGQEILESFWIAQQKNLALHQVTIFVGQTLYWL